MSNFFDILFSTEFAFSVFRVMTPILFAALGALISNKAGIVNIGLEGTMLVAALTGVIVSAYTGSAWVGLLIAVIAGVGVAALLGFFTLKFKTHIILGGIAVNMFASGGTVFILYLVSGDKGASTSLKSAVLPSLHIPLLQDIPVLGPILSGHNVLTYVSLVCVAGLYYLLAKTPLGLQIRSVGENPHAAQSVGVRVNRVQFVSLLISGFFAALGGAYMSMGYLSLFTRDMTAGRGWIGLAAEAVGRSTTLGTFLSSMLFGAADALANALQVLKIPAELVGTTPYVTTVICLVVYAITEAKVKKRKLAKTDANHASRP
ncbi:ABC transporter permease [Paenibacillus thiaminolyticus]|uniref:ABC transporter permease n=1 Tax=Paenibacillus thiaminolyticus TaxID=49283 RepID=A0A3A3GL86_PANTH|nr:ABC transporter permease [Paenibacillus thiaminolyticus]RJG25923.1 ABC transporter permease [Paenibacillus thiaminolyticus]